MDSTGHSSIGHSWTEHSGEFFISPSELWALIGTDRAPQIVDTRKRAIYDTAPGLLPSSVWRDIKDIELWSAELDPGRPVIFACRAGHQMSQIAAAHLREEGCEARVLKGGYTGWSEAGLPLVDKAALERFAPKRPSLWVTRRRPKIDRVACPWLIRRLIDPQARILYVDPDQVLEASKETGGIPFDIEGVELSHEGERCSFDTMLKLFGLEGEPTLARLALIVRGADTARPDLAPEAAGLHAISLGLSALAGDDDHGMIREAFKIYDGLFAYIRFAAQERHNWPARAA
jgi:rhodanese-related sulfurtransferase